MNKSALGTLPTGNVLPQRSLPGHTPEPGSSSVCGSDQVLSAHLLVLGLQTRRLGEPYRHLAGVSSWHSLSDVQGFVSPYAGQPASDATHMRKSR